MTSAIHRLLPLLSLVAVLIVGACGSGGSASSWSSEEREAFERLATTLREVTELVQIHNRVGIHAVEGEDRERAIQHVTRAAEEVELIDDSLLARAHPELPLHFRRHLRPAVRQYFLWYETGRSEFVGTGPLRFNDWSEWYRETRDDWELP